MTSQEAHRGYESRAFVVTGHVRYVGDIPARRTEVVAFERDLRTEQPVGRGADRP